MTREDLARIALKYRNATKRHEAQRTPATRSEALDWGRRLDAAVEEVLTPPPQITLFDPESASQE